MLHVFLVDIGIMLKFDTEVAVASVGNLMEAIQQRIFVPTKKQVLLSAYGVPLDPSNRVASYVGSGMRSGSIKTCGTNPECVIMSKYLEQMENLPFYLFSRTTIDSPVPPSPSLNLGSEASLKEEVEKCLKMKPSYDTLVARAKLAAEFQRCAFEIGENCENLVNDQILQKNGWLAAITNLDHITDAFKTHVAVVEQCFRNFLITQLQCKQMLQSFGQVLVLLKQLPLLPCLCNGESETPSLLEWISNHDQQSTLESLLQQCEESTKQSNTNAVEAVFLEAAKILELVDNVNMKEIKGLTERLMSLEGRLNIMKHLIQDQADMAQGFLQNQIRAEHIGDPSVLPDLCASHQKQLLVLRKNHHQIRENRNLCARAKDELSANLHTRLRWVTRMEKSIIDCDSKLLAYHTTLKRIKKRLDILEQVFEAPKMYILAVLEVLRRKNFSLQFTEWTKSVSESSIVARTEELSKRDNFTHVFGNHFVKNLFPGLDQRPQPFAEEHSTPCDLELPNVTVDDVKMLQQRVPDLMSELSLTDPLETSIIVRNCLSQNNLTKLIDPKQNKTLEETLHFREQALVENDQLTMSVLKREISSNQVEEFPLLENVNFEVGSASDNPYDENEVDESDFEPASLKSLSEGKKLLTSSDSDMLFHSAELDFSQSNESLSPPPGKSSSSPIAIKGSGNRKISRESQCRSLSPHTSHVPKENVFSLPNMHQESMTNLTNFTQDLASSINSSRSLSEALKSTEVAKNIISSYELIRKLKCNVKDLDKQLAEVKTDVIQMHTLSDNEVLSIKTSIVSKLHENIQHYLDGCTKCVDLQNEVSSVTIRSNNELEGANKKLENALREKDILLVKYNDLNEKCQSMHEEYKTSIDDLKDENSRVRGDLEKVKVVMNEKNQLLIEKCEILKEKSEKNEKAEEEMKSLHLTFDEIKQELAEKDREIDKLLLTNHENKEDSKILTELNQKLVGEKEIMKNNYDILLQNFDGVCSEKDAVKLELETVCKSSQKSIDEHLEHVSTVNIQVKNLKKLLAEKDVELGQTMQMKDSLENQKQIHFNAVYNKIKKDKDMQIKELELKVLSVTDENQILKHRHDSLILEINMHKEAYTQLQNDFKKVQEVNITLEENIINAANDNKLKFENLETEKIMLENNIKELNISIDDVKMEKLRVMHELKTQYDAELEKEKASLLVSYKLQKSALEECGKSEHATRTTSIEEGIDELELDRLLDKVKKLEAENEKLMRASIEYASNSPKSQRVQRTSELFPVEKLTLRNLDIGSFIIVCHDDAINQYTALTLSEDKYFLHPDSLKSLASTLGKASERRQWLFAYITEKEYCLAKKPNNKFNLPINTYFSRIHVKPYTTCNK